MRIDGRVACWATGDQLAGATDRRNLNEDGLFGRSDFEIVCLDLRVDGKGRTDFALAPRAVAAVHD